MRETIEEIEARGVEMRPIPGVIGYAAGSDGFIYSFRSRGSRWNPRKRYTTRPRRVGGFSDKDGYLGVGIVWPAGRRVRQYRVHLLVCLAFHGPCPGGMECSHLNGDPSDNRPENLAWESRSANHQRKRGHGTMIDGEKNPAAVLSESDVRRIRTRNAEGESLSFLAREYGVVKQNIHHIVTGRTWRHVS